MSIVERTRSTNGRKAFYVVKTVNGKRVWIPAGNERQEAERLERRVDKEIAEGTFRGPRPDSSVTFKEYANGWLRARNNRAAEADVASIRRYVMTQDWFCRTQMGDMRPRDVITLVEKLKATTSERTGKPLSQKYVSNIVALLSTLFRDATIDEVVTKQVVVLPKGSLRRSSRRDVRKPYTADEVSRLLSCQSVPPLWRVFASVCLMTGMRKGEAVGRRWSDYDDQSMPLGCLTVATQYDGQPLKTEWGDEGEHTRSVPVHTELARLLSWWRVRGWEETYGRPPVKDDFIMLRLDGGLITRSAAYKMWRRLCLAAGVENKTLHSTRHTFITLCRRGGCDEKVLEKVTHNAAGTMVDRYTHRDWSELCKTVMCLDKSLVLTRQRFDSEMSSEIVKLDGSARGAIPYAMVHSCRNDARDASIWQHSAIQNVPEISVRCDSLEIGVAPSTIWSPDAAPMVVAMLSMRGGV